MWFDEWLEREEEERPMVAESANWNVLVIHRRTAWENRPSLKKFYITVLDKEGNKLGRVKIRFDTEPSNTGIIYAHQNVWGETGTRKGREGYAEWDHFGVPARYMMWVDDELLISNLRTDLSYEYPVPPGQSQPVSWRPINRPGVYSFNLQIQEK